MEWLAVTNDLDAQIGMTQSDRIARAGSTAILRYLDLYFPETKQYRNVYEPRWINVDANKLKRNPITIGTRWAEMGIEKNEFAKSYAARWGQENPRWSEAENWNGQT